VSADERQQWAVPVAEHLGQALRLVTERQREMKARYGGAGDLDAAMILDFLPAAFTFAVMAIGNVPGGQVQREVERMITEQGLTVEAALQEAGC
jgi:hypothetical protein